MTSLSVNVTAEVTDLQTKMALAQSELRAFNAETRSLADQMRAGGEAAQSSLLPQLQASAAAAAKAKVELAGLRAELGGTGSGAAEASGLFSSLHESVRLSGESLESLNLRIAQYTSLASKAGELMLAGFGVEKLVESIEGVAEMGAQLEKLSKQTGISVEALSGLRYAADQVEVSSESLDSSLERLGRNVQTALATPTSQAAQAFQLMGISQDWLKAHSNDLFGVLMKMADAFHAHAAGAQADAVAMMTLGRGGAEMLPLLQEGSAGIVAMMQKNRELGGEITGPMAAALDEHRRAIKDLETAWHSFAIELTNEVAPTLTNLVKAMAQPFLSNTQGALNYNVQQLKDVESQIDEIKGRIGSEGLIWRTIDETRLKTLTFSLEKLQTRVAELRSQAASESIVPGATTPGAAGYGGGSASELPQFGNMTTPAPELSQFRDRLAQMQADWTGTHVAMLAESAQMWQQELQQASLTAAERVEVEKGYAEAVHALHQAQQQQDQQIARSDADTDLAISKMKIEAEKSTLEQQLAANQISAGQKAQILRQLTTEEYQLDLERLQNEMSTLQQGTIEYERVFNQIRTLKEKEVEDMAALDRQAAAEAKRSAQEQAEGWRTAVQEIGSAESRLVSGIMSGRQSLTQSLISMSSQLVEREIADDLKYYTTKLLYDALGLADDTKTSQGGLLVHLMAEQQKTAATVAGNTARTASDNTANVGFFTRVGEQIAQWLGLETTKTADTVVGNTTRTTSDIAASAAGRAVAVSEGFAQISIDAAVAAAGTMAAISAIPYVGPFMAPPMAAAAYAETMGFAAGMGGAALDVGAWEIPGTMPATLHQGEMVLPQTFASGLRSAMTGGGEQGAGGGNFNITIQAIDTQTGAQFLQNNAARIAQMMSTQFRYANSSLRPG